MEKVPSGIGHADVIAEVRLAPEDAVAFSTTDSSFGGLGSESVLDADVPHPGDGDSSSCHNDVTVIQQRRETPSDLAVDPEGDSGAPAESLDRTLAIARGETVLRTADLLQASELARRVQDIDHLTTVVASQVMRVMRPWLVQQADKATTPNRFTAELRRRVDLYVQRAITQLLARLS
ncbi:MAG: hypothetical protein Q7S29_00370 [Candidatus Peribacter sp.]|nr:hypothetical protein [Candidatus Peribacter sp.]